MKCPWHYQPVECLECHSLQDCYDWPNKVNEKAPDAEKDLITGLSMSAVIVIPVEEWNAHKERVEAMTNLINGVINGLASNPIFMTMVPPDVLKQMQGKL